MAATPFSATSRGGDLREVQPPTLNVRQRPQLAEGLGQRLKDLQLYRPSHVSARLAEELGQRRERSSATG